MSWRWIVACDLAVFIQYTQRALPSGRGDQFPSLPSVLTWFPTLFLKDVLEYLHVPTHGPQSLTSHMGQHSLEHPLMLVTNSVCLPLNSISLHPKGLLPPSLPLFLVLYHVLVSGIYLRTIPFLMLGSRKVSKAHKYALTLSDTSRFSPWPGSGSESVVMNTRDWWSLNLLFSDALGQSHNQWVVPTWSSRIGFRGLLTSWNGI